MSVARRERARGVRRAWLLVCTPRADRMRGESHTTCEYKSLASGCGELDFLVSTNYKRSVFRASSYSEHSNDWRGGDDG